MVLTMSFVVSIVIQSHTRSGHCVVLHSWNIREPYYCNGPWLIPAVWCT